MFFLQAPPPEAAPAPAAHNDLDGAYRAGVEGSVVLVCKVTDAGRLADCRVDKENPVGMGFGTAALKMSAEFKMKPTRSSGMPVGGGSVRIPLKFKLPKDAPAKGR